MAIDPSIRAQRSDRWVFIFAVKLLDYFYYAFASIFC